MAVMTMGEERACAAFLGVAWVGSHGRPGNGGSRGRYRGGDESESGEELRETHYDDAS